MTDNAENRGQTQKTLKPDSAIAKDIDKQKDRSRLSQQFAGMLPVFVKTFGNGQTSTQTTSQPTESKSQVQKSLTVNSERDPYRSPSGSFQSEIIMLDVDYNALNKVNERTNSKDEFGTHRVYKKTSPNCALTLYLPTREITLSGNSPAVLRGILFVDPKAIEGYRVYAQLTLTFRYGREDEEVMGLRFCNEAILSIQQIWPRSEDYDSKSFSPLQEALMKRLGDGAHPFTLTLTAQAPPSVQLVPAKKYYGAPIGTSYDVRCFIADKTDEKFHRRASVKMGVRVIYRTDVHLHQANGPENYAALINNQLDSPPMTASTCEQSQSPSNLTPLDTIQITPPAVISSNCETTSRKLERADAFPKIRLSPKAFRFSGRFGRSKSEIEKCKSDPFYNYSKSFQEYDYLNCGPHAVVDKPFLLQDGRVGLRASLDKAWYAHGEEICVTINIRNDSKKTVRKIRVSAIQHVDVQMFNNGKFKNVVADSDQSPIDRTVPPGAALNTKVILKPQRGVTKNWIALEDSLQRSTEPDEITGDIAASALRSPNLHLSTSHSPNAFSMPSVGIPTSIAAAHSQSGSGFNGHDDRNIFAIYVSYYIKVKLTLTGMGGELSLKLPFVLVHVDDSNTLKNVTSSKHDLTPTDLPFNRLALNEVPPNKKHTCKLNSSKSSCNCQLEASGDKTNTVDTIEIIDQIDTNDSVPGIKPNSDSDHQCSDISCKNSEQVTHTNVREIPERDDNPIQSNIVQHVVQIHMPKEAEKAKQK